VKRLDQLQRDPHILAWMAHLRAQTPPLSTASYINLLIALRSIFNDLAWSEKRAELAHLIHREDLPRTPQRLPRPLTAEQDELLQQELLRRNDLGANVFLLIRHTGMRIGECIDLSEQCLRSIAPARWAVHVPLGKLKTERMVPVDAFVCELVQRLRFFRFLDPLPADGRLLARPASKAALVRQFRDYLHRTCHQLGLPTNIVPHQMRHTYATQMLRSGVSFPVLMKLLGHVDPEMTMRYVDVALTDIEREFHLARSHPRHLVPQPKNIIPVCPLWSARRHRCLAHGSTCHGNVPPLTHKRPIVFSPQQALKPPHQDPLPNKKALNHLNKNGQRLAGYVDHPAITFPAILRIACCLKSNFSLDGYPTGTPERGEFSFLRCSLSAADNALTKMSSRQFPDRRRSRLG
jgi:site-specific recombinase XerD